MDLGEKIQTLYKKYGSLNGVTVELHKRLIAVSVKNKAASALIFLQGAQLAEYKRSGEAPVTWLSDHCDYQAGTALRGGVPICWPWFGDLSRNPDKVKNQLSGDFDAHGFVRNIEWELTGVELVGEDTTKVTLSLDISSRDDWKYPAQLRVIFTISSELSIQLQVINSGEHSFSFTNALHTYFTIGSIEHIQVDGLEGHDYLDTLNNWQIKKSNFPLKISEEVDRVYPNAPTQYVLIDNELGRRIKIETMNLPDLVAWNPWVDKSKRLTHFADDDYKQMICLESARLLDNAVTLEPREVFKSTVRYSIGPLN